MTQHQHMLMTDHLGVAGGGASERAAIQELQQKVFNLEDLAGLHKPPTVKDVPYVTSAPEGPVTTGAILNCTMGNWNDMQDEPHSYGYQWLRGSTDIIGAAAPAYIVVADDAGSSLACKVKATNPYGEADSTSNAVQVEGTPPVKDAKTAAAQTHSTAQAHHAADNNKKK